MEKEVAGIKKKESTITSMDQGKGLEGIELAVLQQVKNNISKLQEVEIFDDLGREDEDVITIEGSIEKENGDTTRVDFGAKEKRRGSRTKRAAMIIAVLAGLTASMVERVEARGVITDTISILITGHTPEQNKEIDRAERRICRKTNSNFEKASSDAFKAQREKASLLNKAQKRLMEQEIDAIEKGPGTFDEKNAKLDELARKHGAQ